jgi:hypothetical protein
MTHLYCRAFCAVIVASAALAAGQARAIPVVIDYDVAATGQSARASFEFLSASRLQISLMEMTPTGASQLTGGSAILTSLGFLLPRVQIVGGSVAIGAGSQTAGFVSDLSGGTDVSNLWGYTPGSLQASLQGQSAELAAQAAAQTQVAAQQEQIALEKAALAKAKRDAAAQLLANNPDAQQRADAADLIKSAEQDEAVAGAARVARDTALAQAAALQLQADDFGARALAAPAWQVVGAMWNPLTAFLASPAGTSFDGLDGGLLGDALARGGESVIVNSILLSLNLSDALLAAEQLAFLAGLPTGSKIGYGFGAQLGGIPGVPPVSVAEPSLTLTSALMLVFMLAVSRRKRLQSPNVRRTEML